MASFIIPLTSLKMHEKIASDFIDQFGKLVTLQYPPQQIKCPNCTNGYIYNGAGLQPFNNNSPCPNCNGYNFIKLDEVSEDIAVMLYLDPRQFIKYQDIQLHIPDSAMQMRGKISDMTKVERAHSCTVHEAVAGFGAVKYKKMGSAIPFGVRLQSEFIQLWERGVS